jgi:hypothetical protein
MSDTLRYMTVRFEPDSYTPLSSINIDFDRASVWRGKIPEDKSANVLSVSGLRQITDGTLCLTSNVALAVFEDVREREGVTPAFVLTVTDEASECSESCPKWAHLHEGIYCFVLGETKGG